MPYGMGYLFGQLGSAAPAVSPPNLLPTPSLEGRGKSLGAVPALISNKQIISVLSSLL